MLLAVIATAFTFTATAQKPGYTRYTVTKYIQNGQQIPNDSGTAQWVKFENDIMWVDMGFGIQSRYVYDGKKNGNDYYYLTAYNYGTMSQGSGYTPVQGCWALVSPDRKLINLMSNNGRDGSVLKIESANVGEMIE